ncbi:uridine kinase [Alginatibacterium sediminis]|uniref:Uridine kinase n=1 Tax=Alginatibacterium sediminis TaxID=2164068 RepID=A0A420EHG2_9ALTE|nr:uridine kinase [Alginatibacterium sediminis]RKF20145.1 uridine kinase [Alginatibacterium sediminis]
MSLSQSRCVAIGIAGASASGKSLFARTIVDEIRAEYGKGGICVINEDNYYKPQDHLSMEDRVKTNYDHPSSLDHELLVKQVEQLKNGESIELPQYCYQTHTRLKTTKTVKPTQVIIVEGILLLSSSSIREKLDTTIFMDTPLDICLARRIQRDMKERGRSLDGVLAQYHMTVRPMFLRFIEPSKQHADVIIPRGGKNRIAIDIINTRIRHLLAEK